MVTRTGAGPASAAGKPCACGVLHRVPIEAVVVADDWLEQLTAYADRRRWSKPFVFMDANTEEVAGSRVVDALAGEGRRVIRLCLPERSGLLADEANVARLEAALSKAETDSIFSVGSGVITDLARYVAAGRGREFVSVPTAASMDGYASGVAVMEFGGMKTSYPAGPPVAIFADPRTVAAAPLEMTRAGLGDLLGKASARTDWQASHRLYGEYLCPEVERSVTESFVHAATHVEDILEGSPEAVSRFLLGLVESGIAIAMIGTSRPASGSEHQVSHFWDLQAASGRRPHAPHGLQVGYATQFTMRLQLYAFGGEVPALVPPRPPGPDPATSAGAVHRPRQPGGRRPGRETAISRRARPFLAHDRRRLARRADVAGRGDGGLPSRRRSPPGGGDPSRDRVPRSRRPRPQELPAVGEPDPAPLQRARLPGRPGKAGRSHRCHLVTAAIL